jgi:hypothetical protein
MIRAWPTTAALCLLAACNENTATGNDQQERLDPAPTAAPVAGAAEALSGIAPEVVQPEIVSEADIAALGGLEGACVIRLTAVAFPSFIYDRGGSGGAVKLNQKLIPLPETEGGTFEDSGLEIVVRPIEEEFGGDGRREAEMIIMLPGANDELGFRGYEQCYEGESQ